MQIHSGKRTRFASLLVQKNSVVKFTLALLLISHIQVFAGQRTANATGKINYHMFFKVAGPVTGVVRDELGLPIPGVSIKVKGTATGTQTNNNGQFTINANKGVTIVFSFIGYESKEIVADGTNLLNVTLTPKQSALNEVVVNGYTSQKRSDVTAAISTVSGKELLKSPVTNVTNSLAGIVPGLIVQQTSGRPGVDAASLYIRGRVSSTATALIIVDGVERTTFGDIDPNEIESIHVLKDASSTALYGLKGANGVFVVTTKKGKDGPAKVTFSNNIALVSPTARPKVLDAYESASLHTEAQINVGEARTFTDADLQKFKDGTGDPLLYPDVDWYSALIKKNWTQNQQNLTVSGGTQSVKYFTSFGHQFEDGSFKEFKTPLDYSTTPSYQRYNFRARVSMDITKTTNCSPYAPNDPQKMNNDACNNHREAAADTATEDDRKTLLSGSPEQKINTWLKLTKDSNGHLKAGVCVSLPSPQIILVNEIKLLIVFRIGWALLSLTSNWNPLSLQVLTRPSPSAILSSHQTAIDFRTFTVDAQLLSLISVRLCLLLSSIVLASGNSWV